MNTLIDLFNVLLNFWINTSWPIALVMSATVNILIFVSAAFIIDRLTQKMASRWAIGSYIDDRPFKQNQKLRELKFGISSCIIFAVGSLFTRFLYTEVWPTSITTLLLQVLVFSLYYETYSYFVHRLLHTKLLRGVHFVHHWSVRVTPWSSYSVHPVEAVLIAISAPLFMLIFPISLGVALTLHMVGMVFTITIHANFKFKSGFGPLTILSNYATYHRQHHSVGNVNFGFANRFLDSVFNTRLKD